MCGFRECLALLQWMTNNKATKYDGGEESDLPPRLVKGEKRQSEGGKWDVKAYGQGGGEKGEGK